MRVRTEVLTAINFVTSQAMKLTMPIVVCACALALGSCHSKKTTVATGRPGVERPVWRPTEAPVTGSSHDSNDAALVGRLIDGAYQWIGTPYVYGGADRKGADCSGFLQRLFADVAAVQLPRNSRKQAEYCRPVKRSRLQPGDLVFFNGSRIGSGVGHVGLYVGNDYMIHASSSRGVTVSAITDKYYTERYCGGGRVEAITYAARGTRPGMERELRPQVRPEAVPVVPVVPEVPADVPPAEDASLQGEIDPVIVVQSRISALVDSAFAACDTIQ